MDYNSNASIFLNHSIMFLVVKYFYFRMSTLKGKAQGLVKEMHLNLLYYYIS